MHILLRRCCTAFALATALAGCAASTPPAGAAPNAVANANASAAAATGKCDAVPDHAYALPAGRFDEVAQQLAHATGCMVVYRDPGLASLPVNAVQGQVSIRQALHQALDGTALRIAQERADTLTVVRR
ncbi:STN domain-containing protein [Xanthomonas indica]|uniref:STN domain-containing protein n=1 Tax=Xanthomonas indica TaxID=2912242 RepID=A0AAU8I9N1_9XANT|nr:STN domain-containing protein [Xanthomonas indica]MCI2262348.1 STN domain-containing protein [Xanthomonas indica]